MPPLFRIDVAKETHWALDEAERDKIVSSLPKNAKVEISRFKGLGAKCPPRSSRRRRSTRTVAAPSASASTASSRRTAVLNELMGKDTQARFRFIMERARETSAEDLDVRDRSSVNVVRRRS